MSGKLVNEVLEHAPEDLTAAQMLVLLALAEDARDKDRVARYQTSVVDLTRRTRCSPGTVKNALSALAGRMLIRPMHKARLGVVQHYQLTELKDHHRALTEPREGHPTVTHEGNSVVTLQGHRPVTLNPVDNRFGRAGRVTPA